MFVSVFCLESYLTLPSHFGVHHCECQSDSLLVLKGTVEAQKNRCGGKYNTDFIAIFLRCITAKNYANHPRINKVIAKIKRVQFF